METMLIIVEFPYNGTQVVGKYVVKAKSEDKAITKVCNFVTKKFKVARRSDIILHGQFVPNWNAKDASEYRVI